jgi:hypothetical protein
LNLNNFKAVEAVELKIIQKLLVGETQTDWRFDKPTFSFGK